MRAWSEQLDVALRLMCENDATREVATLIGLIRSQKSLGACKQLASDALTVLAVSSLGDG